MKADALLFLAYDYGSATGRTASEALDCPVDELLGYVAYQKLKAEIINGD